MTSVSADAAILICGSDTRGDVLDRVLPSVRKFWAGCPYPIYIGLNTKREAAPGTTTLAAPPSAWRQECLAHLARIPHRHVIVILDDFLFREPVDQNRIGRLLSMVVDANIQYLRLVPLGRSLWRRLRDSLRAPAEIGIEKITETRPFYSGLQIAIWNKSHFASLLELHGSIWDFEHQRISGVAHYAITGEAPIVYSHLVEKGRWLPYAPSLMRLAGLPSDLGTRPVWPIRVGLRLALDKLRVHAFGSIVN